VHYQKLRFSRAFHQAGHQTLLLFLDDLSGLAGIQKIIYLFIYYDKQKLLLLENGLFRIIYRLLNAKWRVEIQWLVEKLCRMGGKHVPTAQSVCRPTTFTILQFGH